MLSLPPFFPPFSPFFSLAGFGRARLCLSSHRGTVCADAPESVTLVSFSFFILELCLQSF